jgi:hypothetical protein
MYHLDPGLAVVCLCSLPVSLSAICTTGLNASSDPNVDPNVVVCMTIGLFLGTQRIGRSFIMHPVSVNGISLSNSVQFFLAFAFVSATLELPYAILDPALDAGAELASEAREVDEEYEGNVDEHREEGECKNEDGAEEVDIADDRLVHIVVQGTLGWTFTNSPDFFIFIAVHNDFSPSVRGLIQYLWANSSVAFGPMAY